MGTAVPRTSTRSPLAATPYGYSSFSGWPYYRGSFRFGTLGRFTYPFWPAYEYGYPDFTDDYGLPYAAPYAYAPNPFDDAGGPTGGLRLKVEPRDAEVYVDGYYAGIVDDFNGRFQRLTLIAGPHRVEIHATGFQPLVFDVIVEPRHTSEYRGVLQR